MSDVELPADVRQDLARELLRRLALLDDDTMKAFVAAIKETKTADEARAVSVQFFGEMPIS